MPSSNFSNCPTRTSRDISSAVTSPPIRVTRRSAVNCSRIDLVASRRVAVLWLAWLAITCLATLAVDLSLPVRIALCLAITTVNVRAIARLVLLRGPRAVRWIEWDAEGHFRLGEASGQIWEASLRPGAFRLGFAFLMLWFATPDGWRGALIDGGRQEPLAFRRLSRLLNRRSGPAFGRRPGGS
jgi:hypothetical protein